MNEIIERIKSYVLLLDSSLGDQVDLLDFIVNDVIDRALAFMNRASLIAQYELDLADESVAEADYTLPIPKELERALASTIVSVYRNNKISSDPLGAITSISDNGQSISYSSKLTTFLASADDSAIFSGISGLMRRYLLPTIPKNENTSYLQTGYREPFL